jgi:predicted RND superfamily exporter protein
VEVDMNQMMDGSMMGGMGLVGVLVFIALILSIAALCKYLFFTKK